MAYFKGQEIDTLDSKGRVNLPAKMRKYLSPEAEDTFTITRGVDTCIAAYPNDEWKRFEAQLQKLNPFDPDHRYVMNWVNMWCEEVKLDSQQRIALPKQLVEFAGIDGKVKIIGMGNYIAFWNPEEHERYMQSSTDTYESAARKVFAGFPVEFFKNSQ
jgi:MraZ protein